MSSVATDKRIQTASWEQVYANNLCLLFFCYGDEENGHRACTSGHLTTANQSEIRKAYLVSACSQ